MCKAIKNTWLNKSNILKFNFNFDSINQYYFKMKHITLIIIASFLLSTFINAQNVKFHDNLSKCRKELDLCKEKNDKASKHIKSVIKADDLEKAKNQANSIENMLSNIGNNLKDAKKDYKNAKKEAKDWGCENTVVLMDKTEKDFDELDKIVKKAENLMHDANKEKKAGKINSKGKKVKKMLKEIGSALKSLFKEIETINESCT